jgi:tRNA-dihydrouridine synthase A
VIQFGGNTPETLAKCAEVSQQLGYDEVNLNVGCPSPRVQHGAFGACLMKEPDIVSECIYAMRKAVQIPVTIKCRLGVDDFDSYEFAHDFIKKTSEKSGCTHYVIHARKAFLKGLNPAENRNIPPLQYERVLKLKKDLPKLEFSINGGFKTIDSIEEVLKPTDELKGCMLGRVAYENPWVLADVDRRFYGRKNPGLSRKEVLEVFLSLAYPNIINRSGQNMEKRSCKKQQISHQQTSLSQSLISLQMKSIVQNTDSI